MDVVVPQGVEAVAAALGGADEPRVLRLVLGDDDRGPATSCLAHTSAHDRNDVLHGVVVDRLRGVQPQAIEMKLIDPIARVGGEELADGAGVGSIEVDRLAPFGLVLVGEVGRSEWLQVVSVRPQVVVNHIKDHPDADCVGDVDEMAEVVRRAVQSGRREQVDAIVPPAECTGELGHGHHFQAGDTCGRQFG